MGRGVGIDRRVCNGGKSGHGAFPEEKRIEMKAHARRRAKVLRPGENGAPEEEPAELSVCLSKWCQRRGGQTPPSAGSRLWKRRAHVPLDGWDQITTRASLGPKGAWTSSFGQGGDTSSVKLECLAQCVTWSLGAWESRGEGISEACHRW